MAVGNLVCSELAILTIKLHLSFACDVTLAHSFLQGWNSPPFEVPLLSEANLKSYTPLSESHPNWCM